MGTIEIFLVILSSGITISILLVIVSLFLLYLATHYFWKRVIEEIRREVLQKLPSKIQTGVSENDPTISDLYSRIKSLEGYREEHNKILHNRETVTMQFKETISGKLEALQQNIDNLIKFNISIEKRIEELESELSSGHLAHRKPFATKDVGRRGEKPPDSEGPFEARKVLINLLQNKGDSARNLLTELDNLGPTSNENDKINFINNLFDLMDSDEQNKMEQYIREFGKTGLQVSISYAGPGKLNDPHYEMVGEKENSSHIPKWRDRANEFRKRKGSDDIRDQEILYVIQPTIKRLDGIKIQEGRAIVHEKSVS